MEKTIRILGMLLGAQLLLSVGLQFSHSSLSAASDRKAFLNVAMKDVDGIIVEGPDGKKVQMAKSGEAWIVKDAVDFPADASRLNGLLDKLGALKCSTPVGRTQEAMARFKVSEGDFERRITLKNGEKTLAALYFGTAPGIKTVHARLQPSKEVHTVEFSTWDVGLESGDWQNQELLKVPEQEIAFLEVEGLLMARTENKPSNPEKSEKSAEIKRAPSIKEDASRWELRSQTGKERLKAESAEKLAKLLADLRFEQVLGLEKKPEYGLEKPLLSLDLTRKDGVKVHYSLGKHLEKEEYVLQVSSRKEFFRLPTYTVTSLLDAAKRKSLLE